MFRIFKLLWPGISVELFSSTQGVPQNMSEGKSARKASRRAKKTLDTFPQKRPVGRPWRARPEEVSGRSYDLRLQFEQIWDTAGEALLAAQTADEILNALDLAGLCWRNQLGPGTIPSLILTIVHDPKFPKKRRKQQISFLADSLAALGSVSPRRSRDICEEQRRKEKKANHIIRHEYYVECSCGYEGPAKNNSCRKCGAEISALPIIGNPFEMI